MRVKKSIINILMNCSSYFILIITTFFLQKLLATIFGIEFLGLDSAFSRTVSFLAIMELGLGTGMIYKFFKPIAQKDWDKISSLIIFIKNIYIIISLIIFLVGILSSFFIIINIKENFEKIWLIKIFLLYILDVIASYLFFNKRIMFIADQKNYINNVVKIFVTILFFLFRLFSLVFLKSFEIYIILKIFSRIIENLIINYLFKKYFYYINFKKNNLISDVEKKEIIISIKSMFFHRVGGACINQIPSLIVVFFMNLKDNGIYSNYTYVTIAMLGISNEFFNGISASFGNFLNTKSKKEVYDNFKVLYFLNFLIYSFFIPAFFNAINIFIRIWMKNEMWLFGRETIILMCLSTYVYGIKQSLEMVKIGYGIYCEDRFFPILEAILNFVFSYIFTLKFGICGIFLGSALSVFLSPFISQPYFVYKIIFNKKSFDYYKKYLIYFFLTIFYVFLTYFLIKIFKIELLNLFLQFFLNIFLCFLIIFNLNIFLFKDTLEFNKLFLLASNFIKKLKKKK